MCRIVCLLLCAIFHPIKVRMLPERYGLARVSFENFDEQGGWPSGDAYHSSCIVASLRVLTNSDWCGRVLSLYRSKKLTYARRAFASRLGVMKKKTIFRRWGSFILALLLTEFAWAQQANQAGLEFHSSNSEANAAFAWAKQQALAYVRPQAEIGPWYEAALPGRGAFCMRDVAHQTTGAAALGLFEANRNMLSRFAISAAASRNWAGWWEIDGKGLPSSFDYLSDDDFWFNLPANFDVLDASVRMWRWTGDDAYRADSGFQLFFRKTLTDYLAQWQLRPDEILSRPRIVNRRLAKGQFVDSRGIPSYFEAPKNFNLGVDLLAAEYRAILSYQEIATTADDKNLANRLRSTADAIQQMIETVSWSAQQHHYYGVLQNGKRGSGSADTYVLYFDAAKNPEHIRGALDFISDAAYWKTINIEEESYVPLVLFRYGRADTAWRVLFDLAAPGKARREYPEVSYAVVAALVSGAMGIEAAHAGDAYDLETLAQPMSGSDSLWVSSLQIRKNTLDVMHTGKTRTALVNRHGGAIRWKAAFAGNWDRLTIDGKSQSAEHGVLPGGATVSWVIVPVPQGGSTAVSALP
jgi:hypothetical protein